MVKRVEKNESMEKIRKEIFDMHLSRILVFSDMINRYLQIKFKGESTWLRVHATLFLITRGGKLTPSQLADIMLRSRNSVTKLIEGLEKDGFVKRTHSTEDRRIVYIEVSPAGLEFTMQHLRKLASLEKEIGQCLEPDELQQFVDLSRKLRLALIERLTGLKS
jgi:DNA-binding MarR family transcriptional regulator